jgi:predicted Zn-dependent protease with MMP-like domain
VIDVTDEELERLALAAFDELPEAFRARVANLGFAIEDEPPPGKHWLATYQGIPLTRQSTWIPFQLPHKVTIYKGPLLRLVGDDRSRLEAEVRHLVRHELAHYFGISDARLIEIDAY